MNLDQLPLFIFLFILLLAVDAFFIFDVMKLFGKMERSDGLGVKIKKRISCIKFAFSLGVFVNMAVYVAVCCLVQSNIKYISFLSGMLYVIVLFFCGDGIAKKLKKKYDIK